jgi:hypothetical protein
LWRKGLRHGSLGDHDEKSGHDGSEQHRLLQFAGDKPEAKLERCGLSAWAWELYRTAWGYNMPFRRCPPRASMRTYFWTGRSILLG